MFFLHNDDGIFIRDIFFAWHKVFGYFEDPFNFVSDLHVAQR